MDNKYQTQRLGETDLQVAGLQLWIQGVEFPESKDYWDGNWLRVSVHCYASNAQVRVSGPILHLSRATALAG